MSLSDPQPDKLRPRPPRANPLQPDRPAGGDEAEAPAPSTEGDPQEALRRGGYPAPPPPPP